MWFDDYGKRNNSIGTFFKRRDDLSGRLFAEFVALKDENEVCILLEFQTDELILVRKIFAV